MADIELVIKIPTAIYEASQILDVKYEDTVQIPFEVIANGVPFPKGHGRIADMDAAIKCIEDVEGEDAIWAISLIEWACSKRIIIEADKLESDGKKK